MATNKVIQQGESSDIKIIKFDNFINSTSHLLYSAGGGTLFQLPSDMVDGGGLWHGGNPLNVEDLSFKGCNNLSITTEEKLIYSEEKRTGIFDKVNDIYYWNNVATNPLGIYSLTSSIANVTAWKFFSENDKLYLATNDVNSVPRIGDYIVFNKFSPTKYNQTTIDSINNKFDLMPVEQNAFMEQAKILDVVILSGTGVNTVYYIVFDKSFTFGTLNSLYSITLLNREQTSIQQDLFRNTFEAIEVHSEQMLGDPYINNFNINLPAGRSNFLNYHNADGLGYVNLIRSIIGNKKTPVMIYEIQDEIKDRIAPKFNEYINTLNNNIYFEFHLPSISITEVDNSGADVNTTLVAKNITEDESIGIYSELYFKDFEYTRIGYLFNDLRIIVLDNSEVVAALSYNTNRNFVLPASRFIPEKGNTNTNEGIGIDLEIIDATNTSPIVITTRTNHNLTRGTKVFIKGVLGNTNANGIYFIDVADQLNKLKLYQVMPTYNSNNIMLTTGTPVVGNGQFIRSDANPGKILSAVPLYNYFYTYRIRTKQNEQVAPYSNTFDFNFTKNNTVDDSANAALSIFIPKIETSDKVGNNALFDKGFNTMEFIDGYGIDIIIGEYELDPSNPSEVIGIKNLVFIPITDLSVPFDGIAQTIETGMQLTITKLDYDNAVADPDKQYDLLNVIPLYATQINPLPDTLRIAEGKWNLGNVIYKNEVKQNRTTLLIKVPADKWNGSTNPTFNSDMNLDKKSKYITEIAIYDQTDDSKPIIYAKVSPAIKKTSDLDLNIGLKLDF